MKSNLEKSRHLPRKGEGELLGVRTRPFPEAGFFNLWELEISQPEVGRERERRGEGWGEE